jgi:hypothetical protein
LAELFDQWAGELAHDLRQAPRAVDTQLHAETRVLAGITRRLAPRASGALAESIEPDGLTVVSDVPYAELQSTGGTVTARQHGWLTIPVRAGYRPGGGYVTVRGRDGNPIVMRSGTYELWAVKRRSVRVPGSRYLQRALEQHLESGTDQRVLNVLPGVRS